MTVLCPIGYKYDYSQMTSVSDPILDEWFVSPDYGVLYEFDFSNQYAQINWLITGTINNSTHFKAIDFNDDYTIALTFKPVVSNSNPSNVFYSLSSSGGSPLYGIRIYQYSAFSQKIRIEFVSAGNIIGTPYEETNAYNNDFSIAFKRDGNTALGYVNSVLRASGEYDPGGHASIGFSNKPRMVVYNGVNGKFVIKDVTVISTTQGTDCQGNIVADFTSDVTSLSRGGIVTFTDSSASVNGITNWLWDFGDGNQSTLQNPTHVYSNFGKYTVTLTVTGTDGSDSEVKSDYMFVVPSGLDVNRSTKSYTLGVDKSLLSKRSA